MSDIARRFTGLNFSQKLETAATLLREGPFQQAAADAVLEALSAEQTPGDTEALLHWAAALPPSAAASYFRARLHAPTNLEESARHWSALLSSGAVSDPLLYLQAARAYRDLGKTAEAAQLLREALIRRPRYAFYARSEKLIRAVWKEQPPTMRRCKIAVLGSSTTALMIPVLRALCFREGIDAEFYEGLYGAFRQEVLDPRSGLHRFKPDIVFLVTNWRDLALPALSEKPAETIAAAAGEFKALWQAMADRLGCHVVQHAFDRPAAEAYGYLSESMPGGRLRILRAINERLLAEAPSYVSVLDTSEAMQAAGVANWEDPFLWHTAKQHPGTEALPRLAELQLAHVRAVLGLTRKVLVCDLDNTMWGGVIGEDGLEGIRVGPASADGEAYAALHRYLLDLKSRGILLAVCSKNNPEDARLPFEKHEHMGVRLDDFVMFSANWDDKVTNLRRIAEKLSLGLDSFVFLDDNPLERAWVRSQLPEVAVVEVGSSPHTYVQELDRCYYFYALTLSKEDQNRVAAYRSQVESESLREAAPTVEAFLEQLQMKAAATPVTSRNLARVTQLTNKTNQFNLTTRRYTEAQVSQVAANPENWTGVFQLADRFGDHGIIGVIFCVSTEPGTWEIDTWLMSCRVLGRQMEEFMVDRMVEAAIRAGVRRLVGIYRKTAKSVLVADLYPRFDFEQVSSADGETRYRFTIPENYTPRCGFIANASEASADLAANAK